MSERDEGRREGDRSGGADKVQRLSERRENERPREDGRVQESRTHRRDRDEGRDRPRPRRGDDDYDKERDRRSHRGQSRERTRHRRSRSVSDLEGSSSSSSSSSEGRSRRTSKKSRDEEDEDEEERKRRRKRRREREREREKERERDGERRRRKERRRSRSPEESREERKERKRLKREKRDRKKKRGGAVHEFGKYGIISEMDVNSRLTGEFRQWLVEERHINPETISRASERKEMATFIEDYNTATFTSEKYYNLEAHERRMASIRAGATLDDDELLGTYDPRKDEAAAKASFRSQQRAREGASSSTDAWQNKAQLEELRRVQNERIELAKRKQLGMNVSAKLGVRMDGSSFDRR